MSVAFKVNESAKAHGRHSLLAINWSMLSIMPPKGFVSASDSAEILLICLLQNIQMEIYRLCACRMILALSPEDEVDDMRQEEFPHFPDFQVSAMFPLQ